jgi:hypothetical protein
LWISYCPLAFGGCLAIKMTHGRLDGYHGNAKVVDPQQSNNLHEQLQHTLV